MKITETVYFPDRGGWRAWLKRHHTTKREVWLIYFNKRSGNPRLPYADAVEEALCFGWIDGIVKTVDPHRYAQRFTPRKKGSNWSGPNLVRVQKLIAAGQMTPAGAAHIPSAKDAKAFHAKHRHRTTATTTAPADLAKAIRANPAAATHWKVLAPGYRRLYIRMINETKRPATRIRRIKLSVEKLARGQKHPLG